MYKIKFGTDGWRDTIAEGFTFYRVQAVALAVVQYLKNKNDFRPVVVGYDNRFMAEDFAEAVARVLVGEGFEVLLTVKSCPTPMSAYAVKHFNAAGAVMITASHNPSKYCGIKYIPDYAGPATAEITNEIEESANRLLAEGKHFSKKDDNLNSDIKIKPIDIFPHYFEHLKKLINFDLIGQSNMKIAVDPMYGAGVDYLTGILEEVGLQHIFSIHNSRDPLFTGLHPDPSEENLVKLKQLVLEKQAHFGLALDGDGDRFGIIDEKGNYVEQNHILALVAYYLMKEKDMKGALCRSVVTTALFDKIAQVFNTEVIETAIGFKHIGQAMLQHNCICGGEESGGGTIRGHLPEKDGILMGLLVAEIVAYHKNPLSQILAELWKEIGYLHSERRYYKIVTQIKQIEGNYLGEYKIEKVISIDKGFKYLLENSSWIAIRGSGTESMVRVYVEATNKEQTEKIHDIVRDIYALA